jgi:hypothetical protein
MSSKARFERLGRELLAEIGLKEPQACLDQLHGFVRIEDAGWRTLGAPWPTSTRAALYVLAHEIGHWRLHTEKHRGDVRGFRDGSTALVLEYEAGLYAHGRLRELGVPVPRWITGVGKRRAAAMIDHQLRTTTQTPDGAIAHCAGVDVAKERQAEWGLAAWKMLGRAGRCTPAPDLLAGTVGRRPRAGTNVDILLLSPAGEAWARKTRLVGPIDAGRCRSKIEQMVPLTQSAAQAGLIVMRF